jgi:hypothetical protein
MSLTAYSHQFTADFIAALDKAEREYRRGRPHYDEKQWWKCLEQADRLDSARALEDDPPCRVLPNRRETWRCGFQEQSDRLRSREISVAANRWLDKWSPAFSSAAVDWRTLNKR